MRILGHGIDIVENARIAGLIETHGEQFLERCFTPAERAYADSTRRRRIERYAVRFAAKEAVLKALGTGWRDGIGWRDVEVLRLASGEPRVLLAGAAERFAESLGVAEWCTSLSHTDHYAVASAIAFGVDRRVPSAAQRGAATLTSHTSRWPDEPTNLRSTN